MLFRSIGERIARVFHLRRLVPKRGAEQALDRTHQPPWLLRQIAPHRLAPVAAALVLEREEFLTWLDAFLPRLASGEPKSLFEPAFVSDASDGQLAHLHGLNVYRAFVWKHLNEILPADDKRKPHLEAEIELHAKASMSAVTGSDYMVEHWLACYAMLYLSGG